MTIWIDAQLSPALARWLSQQFNLVVLSVQELGFRSAVEPEIFFAAREANAVVLTKDQDFVHLLERHGAPPKVLWVTCGNTSNARMREVLSASLPSALELLAKGEVLVEISDAR